MRATTATIVVHICAALSLEKEWFVSHKGTDDNSCGRAANLPCRLLETVLSQTGCNDTIYIDGSSNNSLYDVCYEQMKTGSIRLIGHHGRPKIGCTHKTDRIVMRLQKRQPTDKCRVFIQNIAFESSVVLVGDCDVAFVESDFYDSSLHTIQLCTTLALTIERCNWLGKHTCSNIGICSKRSTNNITCDNISLWIVLSQFLQASLGVTGYIRTRMFIKGSRFSNRVDETRYLGGLQVVFSATNASLRIENSTFEYQVHPTRTLGVINLYEAAVWLKAILVANATTQADVVISKCHFIDNERAITLIGLYRRLLIEHSVFTDNMAMHAGAAVLVLVEKSTVLDINNCSFTNNVAGRFRQHYPVTEADSVFRVVDGEVHLNATCCKGVIQMVGKGGAIRVQRGIVRLTNSHFHNNTASLLGGSVFVDIDGNLIVRNTRFANTGIHEHALQGDILYSDGQMTINEARFLVRSATSGLSILRHSGDHWSLNITNVWVQCPIGYNLRATNSSAYGVTAYGLRRSYKLDQLTYFCESCPRNKYSLDYGYLNYTMVFRNFAYFTLLINGSVPKPQYTGKYIHHIIKCEDCPYGGRCVQGITAVNNFWGYKQGNAIKFQHCPKGYCQSSDHVTSSTSVNGCVQNRYDRLCGKCKPGHSEALFSSVCVPEEHCAPLWLWHFSLVIGLLYALFLLFQTDLKEFLFSKRIICQSVKSRLRLRKSPDKVYTNGHSAYQNSVTKFIDEDACEQSMILTSNNNSSSEKETNSQVDSRYTTRDGGAGFLIILFYYFQDALLLHVKTVFVAEDSETQQHVTAILSMLFKFQLDLFEFFENVCAAPGMTAVGNVMAKALIVPYVIIIFSIMYMIASFIRFLRPCGRLSRSNTRHAKTRKSFTTRLASGFILALMFTFQKLGTSTFTLLNCVPIDGNTVLFIDGTITCYQYWQHGIIIYAVVCVTPFFAVLLVGPPLLQRGRISLTQFFLASLCPLPMLFLWLVLRIRGYRDAGDTACDSRRLSAEEQAVLNILQGPFKDNTYSICWAGVLIGRRLILILLFTFVNDTLVRLLLMLFVCFAILLHHVHVQPYKGRRGNVAGTASAAALVALGCINLVRAGFEAAEYVPSGPNELLMNVFRDVENSLLLWLPLAIMSAITLLFFFRVVKYLAKRLPQVRRASEHDEDIQLE